MQGGQIFVPHDRQAWPQETQGGMGLGVQGSSKGMLPGKEAHLHNTCEFLVTNIHNS